jgi:hypothetical protein
MPYIMLQFFLVIPMKDELILKTFYLCRNFLRCVLSRDFNKPVIEYFYFSFVEVQSPQPIVMVTLPMADICRVHRFKNFKV